MLKPQFNYCACSVVRSSKWAIKHLRDWVVDCNYRNQENDCQRICYHHFAQKKYWTNGYASMWLKHKTRTEMHILPKLYMRYCVEFFKKWESLILNNIVTLRESYQLLFIHWSYKWKKTCYWEQIVYLQFSWC